MQWTKKSDSCGAVLPHLWDYAAGTLPDAAPVKAQVESHLAHCPKCRAEANAFRASAAAMAACAAAPEAGIPPRAPNWEAVQARLGEREKQPTVAGVPWLRALRTSPAFAGATLGLGLCTALCAVSIPWALGQKDKAVQSQDNLGGKPVVAAFAALALPVAPKAPVEMDVRRMFHSDNGFAVPAGSFGTWPLVATLTNNTGKAVDAQISVVDGGSLSERRYERGVSLRADSKPQVVLLYPSVSGAYSPRQELTVTLRGPFPTQTATSSYNVSSSSRDVMALISDSRTGSLLPKRQVMEDHRKAIGQKNGWEYGLQYGYSTINAASSAKGYYLQYASFTTKPETAPDRAIGYGSIDTLVLGQGANKLSTTQRSALRQWLINGGSVIMLPGVGLDLLGISPNAPSIAAKPVSHLLDPKTLLRRYCVGMGTVLTVPVDLTQEAFRDDWELPYLWNDLNLRALPLRSAAGITENGLYAGFDQRVGYNDPFRIALPPLSTVVYLFAGYFLLAVPVTFVVLKQTRRMNWAWATGPALAAVFGGAVYGFTADLHRAKLSRRTGGVLVSAAGEKQARFSGTSELFFPSSGTYDVTVPGAEATTLNSTWVYQNVDNSGYQESNQRQDGAGIVSRSLETVDNGASVSVPALSVPNLAFRRLSHTQTVAWGDGITADLVQKSDGTVTGTIRNGTGRTLENAYVLLQTSTRKTGMRNKRTYQYNSRNTVRIERLAPGVTKINQKVLIIDPNRVPEPDPIAAQGYSYLFYRSGASPVLVATTSGQDLGPTIGQYVGGADTVTVAVTLPPIPKAGSSAKQGGVK